MIIQDVPIWSEQELTYYQLPATDMSALDAVVAKIHSFKSLPEGWHYGRGSNIGGAAAVTAQKLAGLAIMSGFRAEVFPGPDNDILIALRKGDQYYEVIADSSSTVSYFVERNGRQIESQDKKPLETIVSKLKENDDLVWSTTASFIQVTGTQQRSGS